RGARRRACRRLRRARRAHRRRPLGGPDQPPLTATLIGMSNLGGFEKVLRVGEGRRRKKLQQQAAYVATLEPEYEKLPDAELAARDAEWVGPIYRALGMRAGNIENMMPQAARHDAYAADITYGTNSEFGFDYLRDNMAVRLEDTVQRGHNYAIVDEVDSILI